MMSKEKQIEEMAVDLCLIDRCKCLPQEEYHKTTCAHCEAEALYNAGYRKQSKGYWIENEDDFWVMCSECGTEFLDDQIGIVETYKFCPNCGAKMKGGAE